MPKVEIELDELQELKNQNEQLSTELYNARMEIIALNEESVEDHIRATVAREVDNGLGIILKKMGIDSRGGCYGSIRAEYNVRRSGEYWYTESDFDLDVYLQTSNGGREIITQFIMREPIQVNAKANKIISKLLNIVSSDQPEKYSELIKEVSQYLIDNP